MNITMVCLALILATAPAVGAPRVPETAPALLCKVVRLTPDGNISVSGTISIGSAIGLVAAALLTRLFTSLLYEIKPADPTALLSAAGALILTGCLAALVPGLRASRANAAQVLRESA